MGDSGDDVIRGIKYLAVLGILGCLGACSLVHPDQPTLVTTKGQSLESPNDMPPDVFNVPDIPVPPGATIIKEDTVIVGSDENWTGQVVLHAPYRVAQMTEFYRKEMPRFQWMETSIVRARRSAISFNKDQRVVIVRVSAVTDTLSEIDIVVSPNFAGPPSRGGMAPTSSVPQPRPKPGP